MKSCLFQASIRNCLKCVHNCDDQSLLDLDHVDNNNEPGEIFFSLSITVKDVAHVGKFEVTVPCLDHSTNKQRRVHDNMMDTKIEEVERHDANAESGEKNIILRLVLILFYV